jgi:putative membrane protein
MLRRASLSLLACVGLLGTVACKDESTPPAQAPQTTAGTTERLFTSGDTFGVLGAIHEGEVEQGELAQKKASDPRVRAYAEKVVSDHKARMLKDQQLMSGLGISAKENDISKQIKSSADRQNAHLESLSGIDFDRTYLDNQIGYYRMVLDTFDRDLLPNARDAQIRATLQSAREKANDHLKEAQDLRNALALPGSMR